MSSDTGRQAPRRLIKFAASILLLATMVVIAEAFFTTYYWLRDGRWESVVDRLAPGQGNTFIRDIVSKNKGCSFADTLFPHPYLAHVYSANWPCPLEITNYLGFSGRPYPVEKEEGSFNVLLAGGSVAGNLGGDAGKFYFEDELNRCFHPPHGKQFRVYSGGQGGWKQPNQTILFLLYGRNFDAYVSLEGFNEVSRMLDGVPMETPTTNFLDVNPFVRGSYRSTAAVWLASQATDWARQNFVTRHSFFTYFFIERLRDYLTAEAAVSDSPRATNFASMFSFPTDWPMDKRLAVGTEQYLWYVRAVQLLAQRNNIHTAFFLAPAPAFKPLTDAERAVAGDLSYGPVYRKIAERLLELRKENVPVFSLLDMFADNHETLYGDTAHMRPDSTGEHIGYRIMARTMARQIADTWGLKGDCAAGPFAPPVSVYWKSIDAKEFRASTPELAEANNQDLRVVVQQGKPGALVKIPAPAPAGDWVTIELMLRVIHGEITATASDDRDGHAIDQQVIRATAHAGRMRLYFRSPGSPVTLRLTSTGKSESSEAQIEMIRYLDFQ